MSDERVNAIKSKFNQQFTSKEDKEKLLEEFVKKSLEVPPENKVEEKKEEELPEEDDTYYYDENTNSKRLNPYSNKRRREIEKRCSKIDLMDVLIKQRAQQLIPIIPGKLEITLRDTTALEDTFIKGQLAKEYYNRDEISAGYMMSKMARFRLAFALIQINQTPFADVSIENEPALDSELKAFKEKLTFISKYPDDFIAELDAQFIWFKDRIRSLTMENIQNF